MRDPLVDAAEGRFKMTYPLSSSAHILAALAIVAPGAGKSAVGERLVKRLFDPYRPELHYMRGPGPKWREKQARLRSLQRDQARSA
jgi:hypothetical protein